MSYPAERYAGFSDLARAQVDGVDYRVVVCPNPSSSVAVIAPHGGSIEKGTSEIARAIAGESFNLYLLEGIRDVENYARLHLTSHKFDEPRCLNLISSCDHVVSIHGCKGEESQVFLGGCDASLKASIALATSELGIDVRTEGHSFPALDPMNICNRGRSNSGVQIELSSAFRLHGPHVEFVDAIRAVLFTFQKQSNQVAH